MLTSTFGVVVIVISGLLALAILEGIVMYAAMRPAWKTGPGARGEGVRTPQTAALPGTGTGTEGAGDGRVPVGTGHG